MKAEKLVDIFKGKSQKYNNYQDQGINYADHSCSACLRRQMSYPYTCKDGWPMCDPEWQDMGKTCLNWTDKHDAPVD